MVETVFGSTAMPNGSDEQVPSYDSSKKFRKSNVLISSKFHSSLLENKVITYAMANIELDSKGNPVARIRVKDIMDLSGKSSTSTYSRVKSLTMGLAGRYILMEDKEKKRFVLINLIKTGIYEDGELLVKFNDEVKPLLVDIRSNYTMLNYELMMNMESIYSFRIYELLRSRTYEPGVKVQNPYKIYDVDYSLSELMLTIGTVDTNTERVRAAMQEPNPDFDRIVERAGEKVYADWKNFKRNVLEVACEEINHKTDLIVSYDPIRKGRGGKIHGVVFHVQRRIDSFDPKDIERYNEQQGIVNEKTAGEINSDPKSQDIDELIDEVRDIIDERLKTSEYRKLLAAAGNDLEKIRKAYRVACASSSITNLVGFLLKAIEEDYEIPVEKKETKSRAGRKTGFHNFEEREYDFDQLMGQMRGEKDV